MISSDMLFLFALLFGILSSSPISNYYKEYHRAF
jgi:hypothetical protein